MSNRFLHSIGRISSLAYHAEPEVHEISMLHNIVNEPDVPLDAFDRELLAECTLEPTRHAHLPAYNRAGILLPSTNIHVSDTLLDLGRMLRDDIYATPVHTRGSSSSSAAAASSPTVAALQFRQSSQSSSSNAIRTSKTGEAGRYSEGIVIPESEPLLQSAQERSKPFQPSQIATTSRPQGGTTRMGLGHAPPIVQGIPLIAATELPDRYRSIFPFAVFNAVQSKCFSIAFGSTENLVVSAPTGGGKTAIMELAICQLIHTNKNGDFKVVYQAPTKSLCSERMRDWSGKFASLDLTCAELTGDTEQCQLKSVQSASIIITTPEKWDSVTRKWKDNTRLMKMVKLFLIDEVHTLKESRGATLEAVVSRMKSVGSNVRFVALSATVPNSDDIAEWLGRAPDAEHLPAHRMVFGEEFRPVKLEKHVWAIRGPPNDFAFDKVLDSSVQEAIAKHSRRKPTMIFCTTRKMAVDTAKSLANLFKASERSHQLWPAPKNHCRMVDAELSKIVSAGVAFHHGGVDAVDRKSIEEGFLSSDISIICCTSTLAVGVNLPCYLVIIKGTVTWTDKGVQEYSDLDVMQMLGRAGRPQFERSACAVILTRPEKEQHYKKMVSGDEILESCLHLNLIDHLNSEIGLGTVKDTKSAKKWLAGTFMFVRLKKNPRHYQLEGQVEQTELDNLLGSICAKDVGLLQEARLVCNGPQFRCTEFGDAMARYCIKFETMKTILSMPPKAKLSEILSVLVQADEFSEVRFKSGEKGLYKEINGDFGLKFPIKIDLVQTSHKVSLLIQSELGGSGFPSNEKWKKHKTQFNIDKNTVFSHVNRLIRCIIDCQIHLEDAVAVRHALELSRSLAARVWDSSAFQMKQIEAIGDAGVRKLATVGINSIEALQNTEPHKIESTLGRHPPFGQKVLAKAAEFPALKVSVKKMGKECRPGQWVKINFKADISFIQEKVLTVFRKKSVYVCFLAETSDGRMIDFRRFAAKKLENGQEILLSLQLTRPVTSIDCYISCDEIAGTSRCARLQLEDLPASYFPAPEQTTPESDKAVTNKSNGKIASKRLLEFEDVYGDLDDADLLALLDKKEGIEVIHDIDELVFESDKPAKKSLKRTADEISTTQEGELKPYKEPVRLKKGNWTCQHTCKEDGKSCKHICCAEGVKNPAKPGRKKLVRKDTIAKDSTENVAGKKALRSTPFDKACSQAEAKKQNSMGVSTPRANNARNGQGWTDSETEQRNPAPFNFSAHQYQNGAVPKLSFMHEKNISESVDTRTTEPRAKLNEQPRKLRDGRLAGPSADMFEFEFDYDLDELPIENTTSVAEHAGGSKIAGSGQKRKPVSLTPEYGEHSNVNSDATIARFIDEERPRSTSNLAIDSDKIHTFAATGLDNEADYGTFDALSTHLAPAVTQKWEPTASKSTNHQPRAYKQRGRGPFINCESSSSDKILPKAREVEGDIEEYTDMAVEALFATLEAADCDVAEAPATKQKKLDCGQDQAAVMSTPSGGRISNPQIAGASMLSSRRDLEVPRQPLVVLQNVFSAQRPAMKRGGVHSQEEEEEEEEEEKERMAREEQKKKWEGFEDLYAQFGDCVEII